MKLIRFFVIALGIILLPFVVPAQTSSEHSTETLHRLLEEVAIEGRLNEPAQEMHLQLVHNPFGLPPERNERMVTLFEQAFAEDSLLADARKAFRQQYDPALADSALRQITGDTLRHVLDSEQEFYTLQGVRERVVRRYELEQDPPSSGRLALVDSVSEGMDAAESQLETVVTIYRALVSALGELSGSQSFTDSQIDGIVSGYRTQIQPQVDRDVSNQLLLMYHGLDDDALKRYSAFYETAPGKWLGQTTSGSIQAAYRAAAGRFIESVRNL